MQTNVANTGMYELAVSGMQLVAGGGWGEALGYGALGAAVGGAIGGVLGGVGGAAGGFAVGGPAGAVAGGIAGAKYIGGLWCRSRRCVRRGLWIRAVSLHSLSIF